MDTHEYNPYGLNNNTTTSQCGPAYTGPGDPSVGSLTLASIATHKEADSKRPYGLNPSG